MARTVPLAVLTALSVLVASCAPGTECEPDTRPLTGNLAADLVGTWDGFGRDSPVYRQLRADGVLVTVEAPNEVSPEGSRAEGTWRVDGIRVFFGDQDLGDLALTESTLEFTGDPDSRIHRRVQCRGFGFNDLE